jgi:ATP-dependent HslUV protease ATP-binding subunit HslU
VKVSWTIKKSRSIWLPMPMGVEIMAPPGMEEMTNQLQSLMFQNIGGQKQKPRKLKIKEAFKLLRGRRSGQTGEPGRAQRTGD